MVAAVPVPGVMVADPATWTLIFDRMPVRSIETVSVEPRPAKLAMLLTGTFWRRVSSKKAWGLTAELGTSMPWKVTDWTWGGAWLGADDEAIGQEPPVSGVFGPGSVPGWAWVNDKKRWKPG